MASVSYIMGFLPESWQAGLPKKVWITGFIATLLACPLFGQVASSAYRTLGQIDLRQNAVNRLEGAEVAGPIGLALDNRNGQQHLYVADTRNHRVLAWEDTRSFEVGKAAALVLGQANSHSANQMGIGAKGFNMPVSVAADPTSGNLYVADWSNNRVLRFANPFGNPSVVEPDAVYGQPDFSSWNAGTGINSMRGPRAVAFDTAGNLWVADSGNNRLLRFSAASLNTRNPDSDMVIGQADFSVAGANRNTGTVSGRGFDNPAGLTFDDAGNLYLCDSNNNRVLRFADPLTPASVASTVFGQANLISRGLPPQPSASSLAGPSGIAIDRAGNLYVAVANDSRVLVFDSNAASGAPAKKVIGQSSFTLNTANTGTFPQSSAGTLSGATDVRTDPDGNLFIADTGNNRILVFKPDSKSAAAVWGQGDFSSNGINRVKPGSLNAPSKIVVDYSQAPPPLYISDTNNNRILVWKDSIHFRSGASADFVIGQADLSTSASNVDSRGAQTPARTSLSSPKGIAIDGSGNLYVADAGNNRVLRYPRPTAQSGRVTADIVIGQTDFTSSASATVTAASLRSPAGLAIGPDGNLFIADSGNRRVLEFSAGAGTHAAAIRVYGQADFSTNATLGSDPTASFISPQGLVVDGVSNLYVADSAANRVLIFTGTKDSPKFGAIPSMVLGQPQFDSAIASSGPNGLRGPTDVGVDSATNIYIADTGNNRVVMFPSIVFLPFSSAAAIAVAGQRDLGGTSANWNTPDGLATAEGLYAPNGIFIDRQDTLYIGDAGNNRVVHYLRPASVVHAALMQVNVPMARGGLAFLNGSNLSADTDTNSAAPWPAMRVNREIVINDDLAAPLGFATPSQIGFQITTDSPLGSVRIAVRIADTGELVAGGSMRVTISSPGLFTISQDGKGQGIILNQDGTPNSPTNAAARDSTIQILGTGQGPVNSPIPDGTAAPDDSSITTVAAPTSDGAACLTKQPAMCVAVGSTFGQVEFSGLAGGQVGSWSIKVRIPPNALTGTSVPIRAVINGTPTNIVTAAIK